MKFAYIFLISFLYLFNVDGQEYQFTRLTEKDGLPENNAFSFLKDRDGFIWIGTTGGLCRYDGYTIKSFTQNDGYKISDDVINSIIQDKEGMIWVGTDRGGVNVFNPETEKFTSFRHDPSDQQSIAGDRVRVVREGTDGTIWIAFDNGFGLSKFNKRTGSSVNYDPFDSLSRDVKAIRSLVLDRYKQDIIWLGTTTGLIRFNIKEESFEKIDHPLTSIKRDGIFGLDQIDENRLIVGFFSAGIDIYNIKERTWDKIYTDPSEVLRIYDLSRKSENEYWVSARKKGLAVYNVEQRKLKFIKSSLDNPLTPFPGFTYSVYGTDERVWVGGKHGVSYSNNESQIFPFDSISFTNPDLGQLSDITGKNEHIYAVGINLDGIWRKNKISGETTFLSLDKKIGGLYGMIETDSSLYLYDLHQKIYEYAKADGSITEVNTDAINSFIRELNEWDESHAIILTSYGNAWLLEYGTNKLTALYSPDESEADWQFDVLKQKDGSLWFGGTKGITEFKPTTGESSRVTLDVLGGELQRCYSLTRSKDDVIWIGTSVGLVRMKEDSLELFDRSSGLGVNAVSQIVFDKDDNMWLNTDRGFSKFDPSRKEFINYDQSHKIDSEGFLTVIDGEVYYGTYGGYFSLTGQEPIEKKDHHPEVHLLSFKVAHEDVHADKKIDYLDELQLDYWENSFSITFATPNYHRPERVKYAYRLVGQDKDWILNDYRFANYTNLDGGLYTFEVKAQILGGKWGEVKSLEIFLATPFWKTVWFYLLVGVSLSAIGIVFYKVRVRVIQRKADQEAQELQIEALQKRLLDINLNPFDKQLDIQELNYALNEPLTQREFEVLDLSIQEKTNSEIANQLFISKSTVKFHLRNTYKKLGVSNRREALVFVNKNL